MANEKHPEIVTLCGSTKFKEQYLEMQKSLTLEGKIVLSCGLFNHADGETLTETQKEMLDELHLRKIDLSDSIYVIDFDNYIGQSTKNEISYAKSKGKKIKFYSQEKIRQMENKW